MSPAIEQPTNALIRKKKRMKRKGEKLASEKQMIVRNVVSILEALPPDLFPIIFAHLPLPDLSHCFQTCKAFNLLCKHATTWRAACAQIHRTLPLSIIPKTPSPTFWRDTCRSLIRNPFQSIFNSYTRPLGIFMATTRLSLHDNTLLYASHDTHIVSMGNSGNRNVIIGRELPDMKCICGDLHPLRQQGSYKVKQTVHIGTRVFHLQAGSPTRTARVTDLHNPLFSHLLEGHMGPVTSLAADPSRNMILTASADGTAKTWDATTLACTYTFRNGHAGGIQSVVVAPASYIVTAGEDRTLVIWDPDTKLPIDTVRGVDIPSSYGTLDAIGSIVAWHDKRGRSKDSLVCYDISEKEELFRIDITRPHKDIILKLSPQFLFVTYSIFTAITLFDLGTGREVTTLTATPATCSPLTDLTISPFHHQVIASSVDGVLFVWRFNCGADRQTDMDRVYKNTNANAPLEEDGEGGAGGGGGEWGEDSENSDLGYGDFGEGFVPRGRKVWRF
ncbi:rRNA-processing protein sof1 [Rhizophlyctis rosea]|nr:rRNA-processing protein sof1 [Rhizophlyctis rosea]